MSKRALLLVHGKLIPPKNPPKNFDRYKVPWLTEYDVREALKTLGHDVHVLGIEDDIYPLINKIQEFKPHFVFNLLEEFNSDPQADYKVISLLDMLGVKYTGCNSKGLVLARDKALSKKILMYHKIGTPKFHTLSKFQNLKLPKNLDFPLIVKCLFEEASYGIAKASVVHSLEKLEERVKYIHENLEQDAIIEEFIEGRELYVGILGHKKLSHLPLWELKFSNVDSPEKEIYSERAKWNEKYRERKGIKTGLAKFDTETSNKIVKLCKSAYKALDLSGYARIDLRVSTAGEVYILEANPNPNIASDDEFAKSAEHDKIKYLDLIKSLIP